MVGLHQLIPPCGTDERRGGGGTPFGLNRASRRPSENPPPDLKFRRGDFRPYLMVCVAYFEVSSHIVGYVGSGALSSALGAWPRWGPTWDSVGRSDNGYRVATPCENHFIVIDPACSWGQCGLRSCLGRCGLLRRIEHHDGFGNHTRRFLGFLDGPGGRFGRRGGRMLRSVRPEGVQDGYPALPCVRRYRRRGGWEER